MCQALFGYHEYDNVVNWSVHKTSPRIKKTDFLIGIEHELELGGFDEDNAVAVTTAMGFPCNETHDIICARDGSLSNGIEFITHPATYEFHMNKDGKGYDWDAGLRKASELGYVGEGKQNDDGEWEGGHAGTHFNVSRQSLRGGPGNVEHNLVLLLHNNKDWLMEKFSRRTNTANKFHFCFYEGDFDKISAKDVLNDYESVCERLEDICESFRNHYASINLGKSNVIEFRFMTSTNFPKYFKAGLQLIMMMCWVGKHLSLQEVANIRFPWFLQCAKANGYTEFVDYCRVNRINISPQEFFV